MQLETIITLATLGVATLGGLFAIIVAIVRGDMKKFIVEQMEIAEEKFKDLPKPQKSIQKFQFVFERVKEKYKVLELVLNVKKFVKYIIEISKKFNSK